MVTSTDRLIDRPTDRVNIKNRKKGRDLQLCAYSSMTETCNLHNIKELSPLNIICKIVLYNTMGVLQSGVK